MGTQRGSDMVARPGVLGRGSFTATVSMAALRTASYLMTHPFQFLQRKERKRLGAKDIDY